MIPLLHICLSTIINFLLFKFAGGITLSASFKYVETKNNVTHTLTSDITVVLLYKFVESRLVLSEVTVYETLM